MTLGRACVGTLAAMTLALFGCPRSQTQATDGAGDGGGIVTTPTLTPPTATTCSAPGLGSATPVLGWKPAGACKLGAISSGQPKLIHSEAELAGSLDCGGAPSGIDFTKNTLVVVGRTFSPAQMGVDIFDDGKKVTFVSRFRIPCTGDPKPMPISVPVGFMLPAGATRTFAEAQCTQLTPCP